MRTGAAAGHRGYFHEAVCYGSTQELLATVVPFLRGGVDAGEPTIVALGEANAAHVRAALPAAGLTFLSGGEIYARPAGAIRSYRELLAELTAAGAGQIRIIGELAPETFGPTWDSWARYESAINSAYDDWPLWSMCAYDTRTTPTHVLADVARTHPRAATADGRHEPSPTYVEPTTFLGELRPAAPDPVQRAVPAVELSAPSPAAARAAVREAGAGCLGPDQFDGLLVGVDEAVANAIRHGAAPHGMRLWAGTDRIVVEVSDRGRGPASPFAGLLPAGNGAAGGLGLWLTHQMCAHVTAWRSAEGYTVRLTAGATG
jgi:anti-sigma regulatory factor (Ser/Thr protein kinase)